MHPELLFALKLAIPAAIWSAFCAPLVPFGLPFGLVWEPVSTFFAVSLGKAAPLIFNDSITLLLDLMVPGLPETDPGAIKVQTKILPGICCAICTSFLRKSAPK